jgi:cardiolipin synthase A/B
MRKKKSSPLLSIPGLKKTSITSLIILLLYSLFRVAEPAVTNHAQATQLPASDRPLQIYSNQSQDDLTQLYVSAIQSAKQSITLVIYALLDPQVIQALQDKSEAGIPLYIVCDAKASPGISRKLPQATIVRRAGKGLMHQKILVIDDHQILLGSANLTTDSLKVHGNLVFGIDNPSLAQALDQKAKSMDEEGRSQPLMHQQTMAGDQNLELWILPDDPTAAKRMIQLFQAAQKTIRVAMFTWTRNDFTQELIDAAQRGVKVEVVIDRYSGKGASAKIVRMLSDAGISVHLSTGHGLLHHKFVYIDNQILVNGSANWTLSAFKVNDDCFIVVYPLTKEQQDKMDQVWQRIQQESEIPDHVPKSNWKKRKD